MLNMIKSKYLNLYPQKGLINQDIQVLQDKLLIIFPNDLKFILGFYDAYYDLANLSLYSFDLSVSGWNIVEETLKLRKSINLPKNMIVLAEPDEGIILMELSGKDNHCSSKVYWLGIGDAHNLIEGKPLEDNPIIYPSFSDFFEYLLNEEEKRRKGEEG